MVKLMGTTCTTVVRTSSEFDKDKLTHALVRALELQDTLQIIIVQVVPGNLIAKSVYLSYTHTYKIRGPTV